ncbi:hypothetical protein Ga0074812_105176 [Parafrankia irregularis]|uniref:YtxH-like protein n=1 Tax=Parafrankia irregularis TaxID=795642 RepID=A0A0S4QJM0_9ACTN|nr:MULTISPECIES: hypothetical protein [Parafrankia]MBE3205576.1 hypothetical protein [Parafrankia sp. CH37]CUU55524.1 hypothetical protein Ga0074812_105176 [Parafrankia irregularis]
MRIRPSVAIALGVGYVLGARGGREHYDAIMRQAREVRERPEVQSVAGVVSAQAGALFHRVRAMLGGTEPDVNSAPFALPRDAHSSNGAGVRAR